MPMLAASLRRWTKSLTLLALVSFWNCAVAQELMIYPKRIVLEGNQRSAQLEIINNSGKSATYRLELVNRINEQYVLIRAGIDDDGDLWFDYCVLLKGGITKKAIVQATRVFLMLVPKAVNECDEDGIVD